MAKHSMTSTVAIQLGERRRCRAALPRPRGPDAGRCCCGATPRPGGVAAAPLQERARGKAPLLRGHAAVETAGSGPALLRGRAAPRRPCRGAAQRPRSRRREQEGGAPAGVASQPVEVAGALEAAPCCARRRLPRAREKERREKEERNLWTGRSWVGEAIG